MTSAPANGSGITHAKNQLNGFTVEPVKTAHSLAGCLPTREGHDFIPVTEVIYCKAAGAYTDVVPAGNKRPVPSKSLGEMEDLLPAGLFERIHHSVLANVQHINRFKKTNGAYISMNNGDELTVSKSKKDGLLARPGIK